MIVTTVIRRARCPVSTTFIKHIVTVSARYEPKIRGAVSIFLVGDKRMRRLNASYRGVDRPTDVLSFAWQETPGVTNELGELYLSYAYITRQARRFGVTPQEEFTRMLIHGLLHITGYDHVRSTDANKMFALQEKIVSVIS